MKGQKIFLGGMVEDQEAFLGFVDADIAQLSGFSFGQFIAAKDLFRESVGEAFDHPGKL
jgi:hypothetical protein